MKTFGPTVLALAILAGGAGQAAQPPWRQETLAVGGRLLVVAQPAAQPRGDVLTIVIEGDGRGHDARGRPTADPTPRRRVGYDIARAWTGEPVAWVGRLCQYMRMADPKCEVGDWTTGRFSDDAVAATQGAIDALKASSGASRVRLVGWSGGGVMAVLAAQGRDDVSGLVTMAAPLDLDAWTVHHAMSPLDGSHNPADGAFAVTPPQVHLFGAFDVNVPAKVGVAAAQRLSGPGGLVAVRPERHECCWPRRVDEVRRALAAQLAP